MKIIESYISDSKQNLFYEEALAYKKFLSDKRHITIFGWNPEAFVCIEKQNHNLFRLCTLYRAWENYLKDIV